MRNDDETTHFGFTDIPLRDKTQRVAEVFHTVAGRYDLMNDLMSFGLHRLWKNYTIDKSHVKPGHKILDLAGGTGDLAKRFLQKTHQQAEVYIVDINDSMLNAGRDKLTDEGIVKNLFYTQGNAETLPFSDDTFDRITIGFGLRNVTQKEIAIEEMYRVLKPGGYLLILEFSHPVLPLLTKLYDIYSFHFLPKLGSWITESSESYQYLVESIRRHPDQETLKKMVLAAGFDQCEYFNLNAGIVCLHRAIKG